MADHLGPYCWRESLGVMAHRQLFWNLARNHESLSILERVFVDAPAALFHC